MVNVAYRRNIREQTERMTKGPHLSNDGHTLVIPSEWYREDAAEFWRSVGFRWDRETRTWQRDTRAELNGRRHCAATWLERTRHKFYWEFWPELLGYCRECHCRFTPDDRADQLHCPKHDQDLIRARQTGKGEK